MRKAQHTFYGFGTISRNLAMLVLVALLPAMMILIFTGIEQRNRSIEAAKQEISLLSQAMAELHMKTSRSAKQMLVTLSQIPAVQTLDIDVCTVVFQNVLSLHPDFLNITLTDLNGEVLAASKPIPSGTNLKDRKHVREALEKRAFVTGEFIISKFFPALPAFPFAYPVFDKNNQMKAVLTTALKLGYFSHLHDISKLPQNSFVAATDHKGIRLFYYPQKEKTNPIGKPISSLSWEHTKSGDSSGVFMGQGADGVQRIFAFQQVRFNPDAKPSMYAWAAIPEEAVLAPANAALARNLFLLFLTSVLSLIVAWIIGQRTLLIPIKNLVAITKKFATGTLDLHNKPALRPDELGTLTAAFYEMANIQERNQKKLIENEARFRLLLDGLETLVNVVDMDTHEILFINEYGKKLLGDITGQVCWQSLQKGQAGPCTFCTNKSLLNEDGTPGKGYSWEYENNRINRCFFVHDRTLYWVDGRIVRLQVAIDITEKKRAETLLAEEKERLAVTMQSIGDGVITTDFAGNIVLLNKVAEDISGWMTAEAIGMPLEQVFQLVDAQTRKKCMPSVDHIINAGPTIGIETQPVLITKNGAAKSIEYSGSPIRDSQAEVIGVVLVFRDVTELLKTKKELLKMKKLESVGLLAGGIAHDFNNILTAILGNINLVSLDKCLSDRAKELLAEAEKASLRAQGLTQQLLTFAKGGDPVKELSSLEKVIKDSAEFILHGRAVACHYNFPSDLWLTDIDTGQISQVVQNIVLNAIAAMPKGGLVTISGKNVPVLDQGIFPDGSGKYVEISIRDTGIGMDAEAIEKIFDPYFSTKKEGSGLGLAIAQSVITKHKGYIAVESQPGKGSAFTFYLPASNVGKLPAKAIQSKIVSSRSLKILVMDDDSMVRSLTESMLNHLGHEVILTKDGQEAIATFQKALDNHSLFDLIILDLTIPGGIGGKETAQHLLKMDPQAKVVVSSGYSTDPVMARFREYGFCAALVKPFKLESLSAVISEITG